ncbi:MAG: aminoglycoside phosphotransferase family protein [Anaeroplasmataceae bacterium]|nr:aminoglycoside phosphotransferase family protein [Anaeroplasmataceae bacterium]
MGIFLDKPQMELSFLEIVQNILHKKILEFTVEQFCDDGEGEMNWYNVYLITADHKPYVLKKSEVQEISIYQNFLNSNTFKTPIFYGSIEREGSLWILLEYIKGSDLRNFTNEMAYACADSITSIMNAYWQADEKEFQSKKCDNRFERYLKRIEKRSLCLAEEPDLAKAYQMFLERQKTCPRTLCNGDFLQYNAIFCEPYVYVIDWAFAGIMPYSLDIARLIAHGTEERTTFPFYMTDEHRKIYIKEVYKGLIQKPDWEQYLKDIQLSLLNEYIEFIEYELNHPLEERDKVFNYYYSEAKKLVAEILSEQK